MFNRLKSLEKPIHVGIIGIGNMGRGLVYQCGITPGIDAVAMADIKIERAVACVEWLKRDYAVVQKLDEMHDAIRKGRVAICQDGNLLAQCEQVDVLIESSSSIAAAGQFVITALEHCQSLVMMNSEADLMFGPYLMSLAREHGAVYTSCDGDQPAVLQHLVDEIQLWGFELIMAGNIKGFLDRYVNPTTIIPEADKRDLDYRMCTAYADGTKLNVEMALVANALGLTTVVPGMQGPRAGRVHDVFRLFDWHALWRTRQPVVDYILGAEPKGGVFVVGYCDDEYQKKMLAAFPSEISDGPFHLFYRPYHLCHIEAMTSVAAAHLDRRPTMQPAAGFRTNVYAYAKRALHQGEALDGVGGYTCYGLIENAAQNEINPGLPICLAEGVTLKRNIAQDERISLDDVAYDPDRFDYTLFRKAAGLTRRQRPG